MFKDLLSLVHVIPLRIWLHRPCLHRECDITMKKQGISMFCASSEWLKTAESEADTIGHNMDPNELVICINKSKEHSRVKSLATVKKNPRLLQALDCRVLSAMATNTWWKFDFFMRQSASQQFLPT